MKKDDKFENLMNQFSTEAEGERAEEARQAAKAARWQTIKGWAEFVVIVTLYVLFFMHHAEIRDKLASYLASDEPEYKSLLDLQDEVEGKEVGANRKLDPTSRRARLKALMEQAKLRSGVADEVMNYDPKKDKPALAASNAAVAVVKTQAVQAVTTPTPAPKR